MLKLRLHGLRLATHLTWESCNIRCHLRVVIVHWNLNAYGSAPLSTFIVPTVNEQESSHVSMRSRLYPLSNKKFRLVIV